MAKLSVKKDDFVMIIAGKDKGKTAQITGVDTDSGRVQIEGKDLNTKIKKAVKARKASDKGGLIDRPGTIDASNVMPVCSACNKPTRVGNKLNENGESVRVCKKCGAELITKKATAKKAAKASKAEAARAEGTKAAVRKKAKPAENAEN